MMSHFRWSGIASRVNLALALSAIPLIALSPACGSTAPEQGPADPMESPLAPASPSRIRIYPWKDPRLLNERPRLAAASAHLNYYGGKVISNVKVVVVDWGPNTNSTVKSGIAGFYSAVTNSSYFDWLSEYNTTGLNGQDGLPGSNQTIGRGSLLGQVTITPANTSTSLTDAAIQTELAAQIRAGKLAQPTPDTIYMVDFPRGTTITQGGAQSCQAGGFCAYHGTMTINGASVPYGVIPDMSPGSGCDSGCGTSTMFNNVTSVSSHELVEAVTDMEVGIGTTVSRPLAWYDTTNGEIGDICNAEQATLGGYTVQKQWSNRQGACVVSGPTSPANDFALALAPSSVTATAGGTASDVVSTSVTSGSAQSIALTASGAPAGVTAAFAPATVSAGASSTLTVSVASSVAPGSYAITVTGTASSGAHAATLGLTVGPTGGGALVNGNFETGTLSGWTATGQTSNVTTAHGGLRAAQVGSTSPSGDSAIAQTFTAPTGGGTLSFWYKIICPDTVTYDWVSATLVDVTAGTTATPLGRTCTNNGTWVQASAAVTGGHVYTLTLSSHDDNYAGDATYALYDDVTVGAAPPPPPTGIVNGGFESGLGGWSTVGVTSSTASSHGGASAAQLGGTAPSTDSAIAQTFTAPAGTTALAFWYSATCPDTVTYDWATATLKDNTAGTTRTVLARVCPSSSAWTQVTSTVTGGHSYTLTLQSHDDNYAGDATYTRYDDVTLR
jgi:hypothetical protein